jgi:hypothetical protein
MVYTLFPGELEDSVWPLRVTDQVYTGVNPDDEKMTL